jgi:hypothetical protein
VNHWRGEDTGLVAPVRHTTARSAGSTMIEAIKHVMLPIAIT